MAPTKPQSENNNEDDWKLVLDEKSGKSFWYNEKLDKSVWIKPDNDSASVTAVTSSNSVSWQKLYDEKSDRFFFYNSLTGESQWNKPKLKKLQPREEQKSLKDIENLDEWEQLTDNVSGRIYFFNRKLGISQWERPSRLEDSATTEDVQNVWEEIKDPNSGRIFFHNKLTGVSQWNNPYQDDILEQVEDVQVKEIQDATKPDTETEPGKTETSHSPNIVFAPVIQTPAPTVTTPVIIHQTPAPAQNEPTGPVAPVGTQQNYESTQADFLPGPALYQPPVEGVKPHTETQTIESTNKEEVKSTTKQDETVGQVGNTKVEKKRNIIAGYLKKRARYGIRKFLPRFFLLVEKRVDNLKQYILKYYENEEISVLNKNQALAEIDIVSNVESILEITESDADFDPDFRGLDFKLVINTSVLAYVLTLRAYNSDDFTQWLRVLRKYQASRSVDMRSPHSDPIDSDQVAQDEDRYDAKRQKALIGKLRLYSGAGNRGRVHSHRSEMQRSSLRNKVERQSQNRLSHQEKYNAGYSIQLQHQRASSAEENLSDLYSEYDSEVDDDPNSLNNLLNAVFS